jgi:hypothetical protein
MRLKTYGGVLKWDAQNKVVKQTRCLNPPSFNAQFVDKIRREHPEYQLVEEWRNGHRR